MTEINRRYFESLMADQGLSLRGLAKKMDMSHSQLSLAFSGVRKLQLDEAAKLSTIFGEPLHKIVENAGVTVRPMSGRRIAVVGAMRGDGTVEEYGADIVERTSSPEDLPEQTVAVQCRTAGSALDWMDGWVFFCRERNGVDPAVLGRLCFAKIKDGPAGIAAVKRGYREGTYNLSGPLVRESAVLEWATPIIITRN
jgi:transcriptional regulator with XRE-family HTH domain